MMASTNNDDGQYQQQPINSASRGLIITNSPVYPDAWTTILVSLDNVGVWNLRTENLDTWYLGQETYVRIVNPEAYMALNDLDAAVGSFKKASELEPNDGGIKRELAAAMKKVANKRDQEKKAYSRMFQ